MLKHLAVPGPWPHVYVPSRYLEDQPRDRCIYVRRAARPAFAIAW